MIKQCAVVALMAGTAMMSCEVWAAREEHTFEVSVSVPTPAFYIVPADQGWIHREQPLLWDHNKSSLGSVRKYFDVRHNTSAIEARLDSQPYLSNGRPDEDIGLQVSFNGVVLRADIVPQEVVSAADAAVGTRVLLEIDPLKPAGGYRPGEYRGNVMLMFNAKTPEA